jgi:polar amino acid transport system substrate-binding protein
VVLALTLAAAVTACGSRGAASGTGQTSSPATQPAAAQVNPPADIKAAGVIRIAMDETYPPFESQESSGAVVGLDPDLAQAIGGVLGVKVEFVNTPFDAIIPALAAKKVDMAMSSIGDTKARQAIVDFATYYWNGNLVLVLKGNPKHIRVDLTCDTRIGVIRGSLQQTTFLPAQAAKCQAAGKPAPTVEAYQSGPQAQLALESGRVDGVLQDAPVILAAVAAAPQTFEAAQPFVKNPNPGGVAFPKGSDLVQPVNEALNLLIKDGTYARILKKWSLSSIAIDRSQVNGALS